MKTKTVIIALMLPTLMWATETTIDTTIVVNQKRIVIKEGNNDISIKIFEDKSKEKELLYEAQFVDGKTHETWRVKEEMFIPLPDIIMSKTKLRTRKMKPHWAGFGLGYSNIANTQFQINDIDGVSLNASSSTELFWNIFETIFPVYQNKLGITTGMGLNWHTFVLDGNNYFGIENNRVGVIAAANDIEIERSRLKTVHLTIPLLLEWQIPTRRKAFFISAGLVGGLQLTSSLKKEYHTGDRECDYKTKKTYTRPITLDYMAQVGYGCLSIYTKYSPFSIFQNHRGPDIQAVSVGGMLHF